MPSNKVKKVVLNPWTEEDMQAAIELKQNNPSKSTRTVAKQFKVAESSLRYRLTKLKNNSPLKKRGRRTVFNNVEEDMLRNCISILCNNGFSPTLFEIRDLVRAYVTSNNLRTPFKDNRPGRTWTRKFLKRNSLSTKKASMICVSRKANTANPFVIYDFYDKLNKILTDNPNLKPENIWNCDESGFPVDPSKSKVVGPKNQPAFKLSYGARRENITVLAVCNAAGKALDPLIIFQGKNFQSTWRGKDALPNIHYAVSQNGWMETKIFSDWFEKFADDNPARPMLLLFDGHMTHISVDVIERALNDNIHVLKFPPHVTDILQPLDKCCFGPLKRLWEKILNERINTCGVTRPVNKPEFINLISSIWHQGLSEKNIVAGFETTGIFPINRGKYDTSRFDSRLVMRYEKWVNDGKPTLTWTESFLKATSNEKNDNLSATRNEPNIGVTEVTTPTDVTTAVNEDAGYSDIVMQAIGPFPWDAPEGFEWVPAGWKLQPKGYKETPPATSNQSLNASFEEVLLSKLKPLKKSPAKKRQRVSMAASIISDRALLEELNGKAAAKESKFTLKKTDEQQDEPSEEGKANSSSSSDEDSDNSFDEGDGINVPKSVTDTLSILYDTWKSLSPPKSEEELKECFYAVVYVDPKKHKSMFIGKVERRWLHDENGTVQAITFDFLKAKVTNHEDNTFEKHDTDGFDTDIIPIQEIIAGPLNYSRMATTSYRAKKKIVFPEYQAARKVYQFVAKLDLQKEYNRFLCLPDSGDES